MNDERIQRFCVKEITIATDPPMGVMADGVFLGDGPVALTVQPHRLAVMAGYPDVAATPTPPAPAAEETP